MIHWYSLGSVTDAPDNNPPGDPSCDTWARDTFDRTTTITPTDTDLFNIHQTITGTWVSTDDPAIQGTITGHLDYTVTGILVEDPSSVPSDVDLSSFDCKEAVPADSNDRSTRWALRYFEADAVLGPLTNWAYTYDTACNEPYTENEQSAAMGPGVFTEACPEPTPDATTPATTTPVATTPACVDLNNASLEQLMGADDIDAILAQRIIDARPIDSWSEVDGLEQIGPARLAALQRAFPFCTGALAKTGSSLTGFLAGGALLLVVGVVLVTVARRRRV